MDMNTTNENVRKICIVTSFLGILLIFASSYFGSANEVKIASIDKNMIGENIISCGVAESFPKESKNGEALFLKLKDGSGGSNASVDIVFFRNEMETAKNITRGSKICVEGNVAVFNGNIEIIAKRAALVTTESQN